MKPSAGGYFFDAPITGYVTSLRWYAKDRPNWDDADSGPSERSRLLEAKANMEELKAQELDGRLVSVDAVAETLVGHYDHDPEPTPRDPMERGNAAHRRGRSRRYSGSARNAGPRGFDEA